VLFSTDLIYDVLRKHQADHVLLARPRAPMPLRDCSIFAGWVICWRAFRGNHPQATRSRCSPLAVPVMLENRPRVIYGEASDELLAEAADELVKEATG